MFRDKPIVAHISLRELAILDELQGGRTLDSKTKMPEYFKLGELLQKHPEIAQELEFRFHHESEEHESMPHLSGGLSSIAKEGIHGDKTLAMFPENVAKLLDHIVGGPHFNKRTGLRQYFLQFLLPLLAEPLMGLFTGGFRPSPGQIVRGHGQFLPNRERRQMEIAAQEKQLADLQAKKQARIDKRNAKRAASGSPDLSSPVGDNLSPTPPAQSARPSYQSDFSPGYQGTEYEPYDSGDSSSYGDTERDAYQDDETQY